MDDYHEGDLVWFDPGIGYLLPGEVADFSKPAQVITVQALISGKPQNFTLHNMESVRKRQDLGPNGFEDMIELIDLNEASLLWNLKIRYDKEMIYTYTGSILVAVNPYKMFDIYGLEMVKKYEGQILGTLSPHLFAIGSSAYGRMSKDTENQVVVISGESGAGKTESTKLIMQYLAAVNKSPSNLITEQILEANPLLESFGNAKTVRNDNSSRFGKYMEVHFKDGVITGARTTEYLLEKSRIVTQAQDERNYHVFYEMLNGLSDAEKEKYGLRTADSYFYLNQGGCFKIKGKDDGEDFRSLLSAMQVLSFTSEEQDTILRILAAVLHLGNIYFHRKQLKHGQEGVEIGSDAEIRWASHLLQLSLDGILRAMTTKTTETRNERVVTPLNIDQALDARDAIAKALYSSLFSWLVQRINNIVFKGPRKTSIAILDIFGFEDFKENSFEQLCINYANETLQYYFNKHVFKLEQQEYAKERIEWHPINYQDNQPVLNLIAKKPVGILPLLDDESNFPKATDLSFLEKCHYNHALNDLYSRPRMSSMEFGVKHYAGQVWYSVDGFLDKNRDTLRGVVVDLLISSKLPMISKMFQELRDTAEAAKTISKSNGRFVTMKPRTPTVGARFHDSLQSLVDTMAKCHPWFVRCIKPNNEKAPMKFDMLIVLEQLRYSGMLETISIRKTGYPIRMKFQQFAERYRCIVPGRLPRGSPSREVCKVILDKISGSRDQYQLGSSKVFLRESLEQALEKERVNVLRGSVVTIQRYVRGYQARRRYRTMQHSAVRVQTAYRAWIARRRYRTVRKGVVKLQACYRMRRQKREYDKIKAILARKREADRAALERAKERVSREEQERASRAVAGVNHLEIPAELAFIFSKLDEWNCVHNERNIQKVVGEVPKTAKLEFRLPSDIDQHAFTKFTNVYFKAHIWGMKREPIKTPFLSKTNEADYQDSLALFKLILRFMNDNNLSGKKERILGDYIVQKGLLNESMRDEILCQLCNQTWKNDNEANNERGWILMANCLSCFSPGPNLYKYLLKYVSDHAYDGYKGHCQKKLLQGARIEPESHRTYPPCLLEWKSNTRRTNMALEAKFADGGTMYSPVESLTTGEDFAASLLKARGVEDSYGWTVDLDDDGDLYELNGYDYVLDLISETEVPPAFPVCKSFFLVSANKNKTEKVSPKAAWAASPHNPERINTFEMEIEESPPAPIRYRPPSPARPAYRQPVRSRSIDDITRVEQHTSHEYVTRERRKNHQGRVRSSSHERLLDDVKAEQQPPLSKTSALNDRYFEGTKTRADFIPEESHRPMGDRNGLGLSKSKLNDRYIERELQGLSETSKLNKRYLSGGAKNGDAAKEEILAKSGSPVAANAWQDELGLASSALNVRYFSRQELLKNTKTDASDSGSRRESSLIGHVATDSPSQLNGHGNGDHHHSSDVIRDVTSMSSQASVNDTIEFPEFDFTDLNGEQQDDDDFLQDPDGSKCSRNTESNRYVKYSGKQVQAKPHTHSTKAHIDRNRDDYSSVGPKSSAMSDTSEAPSLASHVKNVRIPSHTSDLDQYLDDLFNPVLDGNLDELSDARSLAASIKGGSDRLLDESNDAHYRVLDEPKDVHYRLLDEPKDLHYRLLDELLPDVKGGDLSVLKDAKKMVTKLKGGGKAVETQRSSTPAAPPTGSGSNLGSSSTSSTTGASNLPLYNLSGMTVPMVDTSQLIQQQLLQQQMIQLQQRAFLASAVQQNLQIQQHLMQQNQALQNLLQNSSMSPSSPAAPGSGPETSPIQFGGAISPTLAPLPPIITQNSMSSSLLQTVQPMGSQDFPSISFQQASIFSPQRDGADGPPVAPKSGYRTDDAHRMFPKPNLPHEVFSDVLSELRSKAGGSDDLPQTFTRGQHQQRMPGVPPPPLPPPPPPPPPPMSPDSQAKYQDMYGRAKTVRIGKWRWPPPRDDSQVPGFLEFKQAKKKTGKDPDLVEFPEIPGMESLPLMVDPAMTAAMMAGQIIPNQPHRPHSEVMKKSHSLDELKLGEENGDVIKAFETKEKPSPGSIGKLRISSEMRAKLEQLTMDHSVRSSNKEARAKVYPMETEDRNQEDPGVKKISESRKVLLEQKLRGCGDYMDGAAPNRSDRYHNDAPYDPVLPPDLPSNRTHRTRGHPKDEQPQFVVENLVKSQVQRMERASREIRELREELGHPMALLPPGVRAPAQQHGAPHFGPPHSSLMDHSSQNSRSIVYEESLASSSRGGYHDEIRMYGGPKGHLPPAPVGPMGSKLQGPALSVAASSSYYSPSTIVVPKHREPPAPISPTKMMHDRMSSDKIEFEESSEFLKPMDTVPPTVMDTPEQRTLESIKTKLFPPSTSASFSYAKVSWELRVRKEVFSPSEKIDNPVVLHLVFCQVVKDTASSACIRMNREEKRKLQQLIDGYGITQASLHSNNVKIAMKRNVVDVAKDFPNYFSRLFPVSGGRNLPNVQLLGVSHSGVRLVRRERDAICDYLRVLDTISFEDIAEVSVPRSSTIQILLRNGGWMTLYSHKAERIRNMIERFCVEAAQGGHEYVRAVADYVTREATLLSFRENDIIRVVKNRNLHLDKGWLYGVLDNGDSGIFPCEYVAPLGKPDPRRGHRREVEDLVHTKRHPHSRRTPSTEPHSNFASDHQSNGTLDSSRGNHTPVWVESKMDNVDIEGRSDVTQSPQPNSDAKSLLQFALFNFRESLDKYEMLRTRDGSIRGSIKLIENLKTKKSKGKKGKDVNDWTWKEVTDMVKYTKSPLMASLLKFEAPELNKLALECFIGVMRYMGDYPMSKNQSEVDHVYTILVTCHKYPQLRDEVYCQLMKQTTNNKSPKPDSCQRGWRLFSIVAAYFECSEALKPYLFKYLETAAYDKRRAYHGTAMVCLQNLRKTFKYSGRKNVPSVEEISAISAGRNSKRQIYRLPGGTERVINTKSTTVVQDIIEEICTILNVRNQLEMEEFSLYCIVEGDPYTMPLNREEYILDVTTELLKNGQVFYLIFCRSVWYYPLRLDNHLYIEVIFNQVAPDYLEGLLLVMPGDHVMDQNVVDIAKVAALLHRAADMEHTPAKEEVKYLLPKPILGVRDIRPAQWVEYVQQNWPQMTALNTTEAKAQCLDILQKWPLFGSCFFIVKWIRGDSPAVDHILALNKEGVHFLDVVTHETTWKYPFSEVISTRKVRAEDGTLFLDMKCGNLMVQKITRIQTDQAHEVSRLIRQYINIEQKHRGVSNGDAPQDMTLSRHLDK